MTQPQAFLLDIEGTTTPISFVHKVLFPYAREHFESYLSLHNESPEVKTDLSNLKNEHSKDIHEGNDPPRLIKPYVYWLIDQDRKSPALKSLQGKIWEHGYKDGTLKSPIFPDVLPAIERWHHLGISTNIFSSGSVLAQKLLFAHSEVGDLTRLISNYFDTGVGKKIEQSSYERISASMKVDVKHICFVSDVVDELDAAADAGMATLLCIRPGNHPQRSTTRHRIISSFDEIVP